MITYFILYQIYYLFFSRAWTKFLFLFLFFFNLIIAGLVKYPGGHYCLH